MVSASRLDARGRIAIVTTREAGMRWTRMSRQTYLAFADAKSCGPGLPTLRLRSRADDLADDGGKKARSPGRSRISRKAIAQGMPDDLAEPVVAAACFLFCRRAMGEAVTRHSLRPLRFCERQVTGNTRALMRRGSAGVCLDDRLFESLNQKRQLRLRPRRRPWQASLSVAPGRTPR